MKQPGMPSGEREYSPAMYKKEINELSDREMALISLRGYILENIEDKGIKVATINPDGSFVDENGKVYPNDNPPDQDNEIDHRMMDIHKLNIKRMLNELGGVVPDWEALRASAE